jgi:hypothetical protein
MAEHTTPGSAAVWVQRHSARHGHATRNLARVLGRKAAGRVTVRCYSWWINAWVQKTVVAGNVLAATEAELARLMKLEREYPPHNARLSGPQRPAQEVEDGPK